MRDSFFDPGNDRQTVTISPKFQVVIPLAIREVLHLGPSLKMRVLRYSNRIEFVPVRPLPDMRGFPRAMDTTIERSMIACKQSQSRGFVRVARILHG